MRLPRLLPLTFLLLSSTSLLAQSAKKAAPDTADDDDSRPPRVTTGVTGGTIQFLDGRTQTGATAVARLHLLPGLAIGVSPSYARVTTPASLGGGSASGISDLPVELTYDHTLPGGFSPTVGAGLSVTLPVGDTATGFGSGGVGYSISAGIGMSPAERLSVHLGAGRPLTDFSVRSALGGSTSTWGDAEASWQASDRVSATAGLDGDLVSEDTVAGASRAILAGMNVRLAGPLSLTVNAGHGISGAAARWTFAVGLGTDFTGLASLGSSSPLQRIVGALGGQSHGNGWGRTSNPGHSGTTGRGRGKP